MKDQEITYEIRWLLIKNEYLRTLVPKLMFFVVISLKSTALKCPHTPMGPVPKFSNTAFWRQMEVDTRF